MATVKLHMPEQNNNAVEPWNLVPGNLYTIAINHYHYSIVIVVEALKI